MPIFKARHTIWLKAAGAGIAASLVMFLFIYLGIFVTGMAPFNIPPSAAFLYNLGIEGGPLPLLLHFAYGTFWAILFVYLMTDDATIPKALLLAGTLWLFMMIVYSPIIGWGLFGFGYAHLLGPKHPLYLEPGIKYVLITLLLHIIYGIVLGWLATRWVMKNDNAT